MGRPARCKVHSSAWATVRNLRLTSRLLGIHVPVEVPEMGLEARAEYSSLSWSLVCKSPHETSGGFWDKVLRDCIELEIV